MRVISRFILLSVIFYCRGNAFRGLLVHKILRNGSLDVQRRHDVRQAFSRTLSTSVGLMNDNTVLPKGDYNLLPRLYVGSDPIQRQIKKGINLEGCLTLLASETSDLVPRICLSPSVLIELNDDQSHYLMNVLRIQRNKNFKAYVRIFDGVSGEWLARIQIDGNDSDFANVSEVSEVNPTTKKRRYHHRMRSLCVECLSLLRPQHMSTQCKNIPSPWLCVPVPCSKDRWRWMLEKSTEMSVGAIVTLKTHFCSTSQVPSFSKASAYILEAAEQSERLCIPDFVQILGDTPIKSYGESPEKIAPTLLPDLLNAVAASPASIKLIVCRERRRTNVSIWQAMINAHSVEKTITPIAFCIGPEGGWSPSEEERFDRFQSQYPSAIYNVSIGPTVLRMETAALAVLALYRAFYDHLIVQEEML